MNVVVDTNILFSAMLREKNRFAEILFLDTDNHFFTPRYAVVELFKHKEKILRFSKSPEEVLLEMLHRLLKQVQFVDEELISTASYLKAWNLCKDVDEKDLVFVAMSLELDAHFWTIDKQLENGLRERGFDQFFQPI